MRVVVGAEVETQNIGGNDPDDVWTRDSYSGYVSNVFAREAQDWENDKYSYSNDTWEGELDVAPGATVYAVVADYETGDTFGRDGGNAQILDVFTTQDEAEALAKEAVKTMPEGASGWRKNYEYSFVHRGKTYSRAWAGYFETLESLDVWTCNVGRRSNGEGYGIRSGK